MADAPKVTAAPRWLRYGIAVAAAVLANAARAALDPLVGDMFPFAMVFFAVLGVAWYCGFGPSVLAAALGGVLAAFLFLPPRHSLAMAGPSERMAAAVYVVLSGANVLFGRAMHRLRERAEAAAAEADAHRASLEKEVLERRRTERDLDRYRLLAEHSRDILLFLTPAGRIVEANAAAVLAYGYTHDELLRMTAAELRTPEGARRLAEELAQSDRRGGRFETVHRRKDGSTFPVEISSRGADVGGERLLLSAVRDVTERRDAEAALRGSEERLRLAQQAAKVGAWDWNLRTGAVAWSEGVFDLLALPPGAVAPALGVWSRYVHPDDRPGLVARVDAALAGGGAYDDEFRVVRADGAVRWLAAKGRVVRDAAGRPDRMVGVNIDVDDRRRAEEALKDADRRKDEFLAMLAHELRNPLAPVRNALQILKSPAATAAQCEAARAMMERQVAHLARLVDDLLDVSRILRGKVELRRGRTDLGEAVRRAVEIAQPAVDAGRHALTVELPAEPLPVDGDPVRLAQVVSNLLHNAAKFTEPGGRIAASAERIDGRAVLRVRDTGCGIDPKLLPRVFDLFVQGDRSAARTQGGLGIGLTLARQLVELHGGTVAVQSGGPGQGSTFTVQLPLASGEGGRMEEAGARAAEPAALGAAALSLRVLVVDDNADAADSLAFLLNLSGHDARTFHSGPDALAAAAEFRPDAFVLDIGLPGMDGHEIARRLRAQPAWARTLLVAVTGYGQEADRVRSAAAGFDYHLVKPIDPAELNGLLVRHAPEAGRTPS